MQYFCHCGFSSTNERIYPEIEEIKAIFRAWYWHIKVSYRSQVDSEMASVIYEFNSVDCRPATLNCVLSVVLALVTPTYVVCINISRVH